MVADRAPGSDRALNGFTLVELLIALVLVGMISAALFSALRSSGRSWRAGDARLVAAAEDDAFRHFLRDRLMEAMPVSMPGGAREREPVFRGSAARLRFAAPMPHALGLGGIYVFTLAPGEGSPLMLDWHLLRPDRLVDVAEGRLRPRPLFSTEIEAIHFRYYGVPERASAPRWTTEWESADPPRLVEIRFEAREGRAAPPPIRVAIAAAS